MTSRAESLGIDELDDGVVGRILGQVDEVVLGEKLCRHGEPKP